MWRLSIKNQQWFWNYDQETSVKEDTADMDVQEASGKEDTAQMNETRAIAEIVVAEKVES